MTEVEAISSEYEYWRTYGHENVTGKPRARGTGMSIGMQPAPSHPRRKKLVWRTTAKVLPLRTIRFNRWTVGGGGGKKKTEALHQGFSLKVSN